MTDFFIHNDIYLRALEPEDVDVLYRWENDTRHWKHGATINPYSRFSLKQYIAEARDDIHQTRQLRMVAVEKVSEKPVGTIDLYDFDFFHQRAGIGILIDEDFREKGYALQVLDCIERYAFNHLKLHQLYAFVPEKNQASIALFTKANYQQTAVLKSWLLVNRSFNDVVVMQKMEAPPAPPIRESRDNG